MQDGTAGLGSYPDLLKDMLSSDVNVAIVASKNLLSVAESTQVTRQWEEEEKRGRERSSVFLLLSLPLFLFLG